MTPLWTHRLASAAGGLALARESGHVLAWDAQQWLVLLNRRGELQSQTHLDTGVVAAGIAEDGSGLAVADDRGQVTWLARDLSPRWRHTLPPTRCAGTPAVGAPRPTALAVDPLGRGLAVADAGCKLHFFDRFGHPVEPTATSSRPLVHLLIPPAAPFVLAAADFGLIAALDARAGRWTWQDAPVVHLGALAAAGDGHMVAVSCFSEGIRRYDAAGHPAPALPTPEPCRLLAATYNGRRYLAGSIFGAVHGLDAEGAVRCEHRFEQPVVALALAPLGDWAAVALADGRVVGLDMGGALG
jgi:hypothetical protein